MKMRFLLSICLIIIANCSPAQKFDIVETETDSFYKILLDSINLAYAYPDGRYKVYESETDKIPEYVFNLENNKVSGPYLELCRNKSIYGTYSNDSLWTFLTNPDDTTFKIGTWRGIVEYYSVFIKGNDYHVYEQIYKMPFDSNDIFREIWLFHKGNIAREAIYKKGGGLMSETYWGFDTCKIINQTINFRSENYKHSITYENDSISLISITQNGIELFINFDQTIRPYLNNYYLDISVYSDDWERSNIPIATMSIDSNKTLTDFFDIKRQVSLSEDKNGNMTIRYRNRKGKMKIKKLK
jgi:hypothetical protein